MYMTETMKAKNPEVLVLSPGQRVEFGGDGKVWTVRKIVKAKGKAAYTILDRQVPVKVERAGASCLRLTAEQ